MPLRTRNQFTIKAQSTERTHVLPLYVHVRDCDLAFFHDQERSGLAVVQTLLTLLDGDAAFQALVHELDNVRMIDELIKTKSSTLFHVSTGSDVLQIQWQLQDHAHSLVNILQKSSRPRKECLVKKTPVNGAAKTAEDLLEYKGGMLRPLPARKAGVAVWIYPPHVKIPLTGDRVPANPECVTDFFHTLLVAATLSRSSPSSSSASVGGACRCGQSWSDGKVQHFCQLIDTDLDISVPSRLPLAGKPPPVARSRDPGPPPSAQANSNRFPSTVSPISPLTEPSPRMSASSPETSASSTAVVSTGASPSNAYRRGVSENIQVFIRIRPLIDRETSHAATASSHSIRTLDDRTIEVRTHDTTLKCSYDAVFDPSFSQDQVYERVRECTQSFLAGFNSTLFAYGQTGSGKSFTMFGNEGDISRYRPGHYKSQAGIIPRAIKEIFEGIVQMGGEAQGANLYCSFVQIYNEQIFDLLRDGTMESPLEIHEDRKNGIYVDGLSEYAVRSVNDCLALLQGGEQHRAVRSTHMNQASSRSHSVFQLLLEQRRQDGTTIKSKFNLVDLAGSEKWNFGTEMQQFHISEMTNINLSLHTLGRCIAALSAKNQGPQHVPYRDSKLTRLLQDSLGGNTKTKIIATLSPSLDCIEESISTLKFADRAKKVMVTVRVNEQREIDPAYVEKLEDEIHRLKEIVKLLQSGRGGLSGAEGGPEQNCEEEDQQQDSVEDPGLRKKLARMMQENMELKEAQERQQKEIGQLRARLMGGGGTGTGGVGGGAGGLPLSTEEANLLQTKHRLETTLRQLKDASDKFFKFEIEEEELKSIHERVFKGQQVAGSSVMSPVPGSISKPRPPSLMKPSGSLASPGGFQKPMAVDLQYRVRGRSSSQSARGSGEGSASSSSSNNNKMELRPDTVLSKQPLDPEKELELSRKAIEKQQKLQNWLVEKEKRELLKLQQEHEYMEGQRRMLADRDAKFFKRAEATKKKLLAAKQSTSPGNPESE